MRIAPGVRVRASSRGLRTSIGPRVARIHVGAGRPGISTGVGPVGFYQSLGGSSRGRKPAAYAGQTLAQAKADAAEELLAAIRGIRGLHRVTFPMSSRPLAEPPPAVDRNGILRRHERAALAGVRFWDFRGRGLAKSAAATAAEKEVAELAARHAEDQRARQKELDDHWELLLRNDPDVVTGALTAAFDDNEATAVVVDVSEGEASLVVLVPDADVIPDRYPTVTQAGNLSLKRMTKSDQAALYRTMVSGYVLVTVKEALAVAPRLDGARVVAIRIPRQDAYGHPVVEALLGGHLGRAALEGVRWSETDAASVLVDASDELVFTAKGAAKALVPLDLAAEPAIARIVDAVDVEDLR